MFTEKLRICPRFSQQLFAGLHVTKVELAILRHTSDYLQFYFFKN